MLRHNPKARSLKAAFLGLGLLLAACADTAPDSQQEGSASKAGAPAAAAESLPAFTRIVQSNRDAVVNISTTRKVDGAGPELPERFRGTPFEDFFRRFFGGPGGGKRKVHSLGSGFIVSSGGHIVTNAHVVKDASTVVVQLADRRQLKAEILGKDMATDVAVLKIDAEDLPTVAWSEGKGPRVGEWVLAMGSPFGFEHTVTAGIVSAKGRTIPGKAGSYVPFLQTDVAINPGSSGGPLFNLDGKVVGVNAQIYSKSGGYMGLSFAIPGDVARDVVREIKAKGKVTHGYLGVSAQDMNRKLASSLGLDRPRGGLIAQVRPGSPAEETGLKPGDVILAVDGHRIARAGNIPPLIGGLDPGTKVTLTLLREKKRIQKVVTLGSLAEARGESGKAAKATSALGMRLIPVPDGMRDRRPLPDSGGALVKGVRDGPARKAGIRPGDVALRLGDALIEGPAAVKRLLAQVDSGARVPVLVQRGKGTLFVPLQVP